MILFWLIMTIMILISLTFTMWPLIKTPRKNFAEDDLKKKIFQQQLHELDAELSVGLLDHQSYQSARTELAASFIHDQRSSNNHIKIVSKEHRDWIMMLFFIIFIPIFSLSMYWQLGDRNKSANWLNYQNNAMKIQAFMATIKSPGQLINNMQQILKKHPRSAQGWYLLGRLYMSMNQYPQAGEALAKAHVLKPHDLNYMLQYAQTLFLIHNNHLNSQAAGLLQNVLANDPENAVAKNLLALDAYQNKQYSVAIKYWEQLLKFYEPDSEEGKILLQEIAKAQHQL